MHRFLIAAALILAPTAAQAQDWVFVAMTENSSGAFFLDADSLKREGDIRTADVFALLRVDDGGRAAAIAPVSFDCKGQRRLLGAGTDYDAQGNPVQPAAGEGWANVRPGSTYALLMDAMCSDTPLSGAHFGAKPPIAQGRQMLEDQMAQDDKAK